MQSWSVLERSGKLFFLEMPHIRYYEFATRNFIKFQDFSAVVDKLRDKSISMTKVDEDSAWYDYHNSMINILIYGALSLEAYMNFYAKKYEIPFNNETERLPTLHKWRMYPTIKTGKPLPPEVLKTIKSFFNLRDEFVHPKPTRLEHGKDVPDDHKNASAVLERKDKGELMNELNSVYKAIFKLDKDEDEAQIKTPCYINS